MASSGRQAEQQAVAPSPRTPAHGVCCHQQGLGQGGGGEGNKFSFVHCHWPPAGPARKAPPLCSSVSSSVKWGLIIIPTSQGRWGGEVMGRRALERVGAGVPIVGG